MMPLILLAAAAADLDSLDDAIGRCDRAAATPIFADETRRRAQFLVDAYRTQESIVTDRGQLIQDRADAREAGTADTAANKDFDLRDRALDDRQRSLNDSRSLEAAREQAIDAMRHYYLSNCPAGKDPVR